MSIKPQLLHSAGAIEQHYCAGDYIFREDSSPQFYFQIVEGDVKLCNFSSEGKEFIQNIFSINSCFGEAMLFLGKPYPIDAIALTDCTILKLCKANFMTLLDTYPQLAINVCKSLSEKNYTKFVLMRKIASKNAIERLTEVMDMMKEPLENKDKYSFEIPHTRQQLASLTGLCVETAIRAIKKMEAKKVLKIRNRKIYY
jgi:CRP-like cAMP-binding protein